MTKDGRPSRIDDIRLFFGDRLAQRYLEDHEDAVAFARRIAWFLNGEGFSLGAYPALYVLFTPSLEPAQVEVTDRGGDWWQRYTNVGVPRDFQTRPDASDIAMSGIVSALKAIRPDCSALVDHADETVRRHGDNLRFLIKTRQSKRFDVEVTSTIAVWPTPSMLFVSLTDRSTGEILEAPPLPLQIYTEAFHLAGSVSVSSTEARARAGESLGAELAVLRHGGPLRKSLSEFVPTTRPVSSKLVRRR